MTAPAPRRDIHGDGLFDDEHAGYGGDRLGMRDQWFREAEVRLQWMARHGRRQPELLEIGSATGELVAVAERQGLHVVGLETSPWAVSQAAHITSSVLAQDLASWRARNAGRTFDAIALFHVLEHFSDPRPILRELLQVIRPSGRLFLEVPNGGSTEARSKNVAWGAARPEDHYFHYTADGLGRLLRECGWSPARLTTHRAEIYGGRGRPYFAREVKDQLRRRLSKPTGSRDLLRAVAVPAGRNYWSVRKSI